MSTTYAPPIQVRRPHIDLWLVATIGLVLALAAVGTWVLVARYTGPERTATTVVDDLAAAISARDATAIAGLYTEDAILVTARGTRHVGGTEIATALAGARAYDARLERVAPVTTEGKLATTFIGYEDGPLGTGTLLGVFQLEEGKIARHWEFEMGVTSPFGVRAMVP